MIKSYDVRSSYDHHKLIYRVMIIKNIKYIFGNWLIAASILWNSLPPDIQSSSLTDFWHRLKTYL